MQKEMSTPNLIERVYERELQTMVCQQIERWNGQIPKKAGTTKTYSKRKILGMGNSRTNFCD